MGRRRQAVSVTEVSPEALDEVGFPGTRRVRLKLGGDRVAFVFTLTAAARAGMTDIRFRQVAQQLGDLVHPHRAVLIVLPDGAPDLRAYALEATR